MSDIIAALTHAVGADVICNREEAAKRVASLWGTLVPLDCKALLLPRNTEELSRIMKICFEYGQTVVPRAGLTSVMDGVETHADDIAISVERMNEIAEINTVNKTVIVGAGVILEDLHRAVEAKNLLFPLNLGAKGSCMIGGNISTNAGGLEAVRYGVTRNQVLGLEVVLADGTIVSSMNQMIKNNAGYDVKQLFIGSEGTLGIVTKAVLKLEDKPVSKNTALIAVLSFDKTCQLLHEAKKSLNNQLTSFEVMWNSFYRMETTAPSSYAPPLPNTFPYYVLMEQSGNDQAKDAHVFERFLESCFEKEIIADATVAQSESEHQWLWGIRENIELVFQLHQPVFGFDISIPINEMENYVNAVSVLIKKQWTESHFYSFGHIADGNLHLFVHCGQKDAATKKALYDLLFEPLSALGGSITAEHGIGLEKKPWLHLSRSPAEIALMRVLKHALDPKNILNRGKIFDF